MTRRAHTTSAKRQPTTVCPPVPTLGRAGDGGAATAGRPDAALFGALGAIAMNNLPAASLMSAQPLAHPFFLLLGLNLGPNLVITGSLSAVVWWRLARQNARVSMWTFTRCCPGARPPPRLALSGGKRDRSCAYCSSAAT